MVDSFKNAAASVDPILPHCLSSVRFQGVPDWLGSNGFSVLPGGRGGAGFPAMIRLEVSSCSLAGLGFSASTLLHFLSPVF